MFVSAAMLYSNTMVIEYSQKRHEARIPIAFIANATPTAFHQFSLALIFVDLSIPFPLLFVDAALPGHSAPFLLRAFDGRSIYHLH